MGINHIPCDLTLLILNRVKPQSTHSTKEIYKLALSINFEFAVTLN